MVVHFASHEAALSAKEEAHAARVLCAGADTLYNEHPYDKRGWCCGEDAISLELVRRLTANPRMERALATLQPKMFTLSSSAPPTPVEGGGRTIDVEREAERIRGSKFTSKGDHEVVVNLYREYVYKLARALQDILGSALPHADDAPTSLQLPAPPTVALPPPPPLRLAPGHLLLLVSRGGAQFGAVDSSGRRVAYTLAGGDTGLAVDACTQEVLPWRPVKDGWGEALLRDVEALRALDTQALSAPLVPPYEEEKLRKLRTACSSVVEAVPSRSTIRGVAVEAGEAAQARIREAERESARVAGGTGDARELASRVDAVRSALARLLPEALAVAALRSSGGVGARRYAAGQPLTARLTGE